MHVTVTTEAHFAVGPDGVVRSDTGGRAYEFWARYLDAFESVKVLARVSFVDHTDGYRVTGPNVEISPIPGYGGLAGTLKALGRTRKSIYSVAKEQDMAFIARVPSLVGTLLVRALRRARKPYALEVVGDPYEVFQTGVSNALFDPALRQLTFRSLRRECANADAISYVTESQLQTRYPPKRAEFVTHYSSVHLPTWAFATSPKVVQSNEIKLVTVGTQSQMYKGHDILIAATAELRKQGHKVRLTLVGSGRYQPHLKALAVKHQVGDFVRFAGRLGAGAGVIEELDRSDVFVLPSLTEGLPRSLIEAMARGLPCLASCVGGVSELLEPDDMFMPGDVDELVDAICAAVVNPKRMNQMAARNLLKAREYHEEVLTARRRYFFEQVQRLSEASQ